MNEIRPFEEKEINVLRSPTSNSNWSECNKCPMKKAIGSPAKGKKFRNNINKRHLTKVHRKNQFYQCQFNLSSCARNNNQQGKEDNVAILTLLSKHSNVPCF